MTTPQILVFSLLATMMALFVWDRWRYDLVALMGLLAALLLGLVPAKDAFDGFGDDVVVIVASALVLSAGIARSGLLRRFTRLLEPRLRTPGAQVATLTGAVTVLAMGMKNIGALAIFLPVALQVARRTGTSPSLLLMPMAFGTLVGGVVTLVGTSPNILVSRVRQEVSGEPFGLFDFTPVGLGLVAAALLFLSFGWRLLGAAGRRAPASTGATVAFVAEARLPDPCPFAGQTLAALEAAAEGEVSVAALLRGGTRQDLPDPATVLATGDALVLRGAPAAIRALVAEAGLVLAHADKGGLADLPAEAVEVAEAVILPASPLAGRTPRDLRLRHTHGVNLLAVSRRGAVNAPRVREARLGVGDVLVLQGPADRMEAALAEMGCLPLEMGAAELGRRRLDWAPVLLLAGAMGSVALGWLPVSVAFFGAAVLTVLLGVLTLREAYEALDIPILVLLAAMIPISDAVSRTGGAELIASGLAAVAVHLPAIGALALVLLAAMALTPFLNNAATALIMAPVAAQMARQLGLNADPFLMAVAIGCACDFLTPIGHQCNTLVMGPGGYRFGDYARLGLPLSLLVAAVATALIPVFWPLSGG
ncbi:SLC13 family permease [Roseococcus sp. DSY-14]|uniref:SLC13 family permease n=1 Tax=Roseococcus sp. DSY-14 TaxID=3369650 RepID=UPI00387B203B